MRRLIHAGILVAVRTLWLATLRTLAFVLPRLPARPAARRRRERPVVLILSFIYRRNAGYRHRVAGWRPWLEEAGFRVVEDEVVPEGLWRTLYDRGGEVRRTLFHAIVILRRLLLWRKVRDADVVVLRRKAVPLFPYTRVSLEHLYIRLNPRLVVDVDDALHLPPAAPPGSRFGRLVDPDHFLRVVGDAAGVLAGSETLAETYRSRARRLLVLPTCVDVEPARGPGDGDPVIGWVGNPGGLDRLMDLGPALARLASRHAYRLRVVSSRGIDLPGVPVEFAPWSYEGEGALLAGFDVSLNPLDDTEFDRGRCALKVLLSMARGVAVVASPVGANAEIVRDGVNGLLAGAGSEWEDALARLLADPGLRRRMGKAGRRTVARRFTFAANAPRLVGFLAKVAR